ncbi:MAG: tRNA pseudouridine(38-40) synthase TruA [Christensenellales bacterium]|jgi:tRNA pseudouridine38-40 synthase
MKRYKMTVEYLGTNYSGWQSQAKGVGVQQIIEAALSEFFKTDIKIHGSGRTDKGAHAKGQVAHFDIDTKIKEYNIIRAVNLILPSDIQIQNLEIVDNNFHSQYDAKSKVYEYKAYISKYERPTLEVDHARIIPPIDMNLIREKAKLLVGTHDFKAFCAVGSAIKDTTRTIYSIDVLEHDGEIIFRFEGNGFLYNMIRIIVGTLVFLGKGAIAKDSIEKMLETGDRDYGGKTYAAKGLTLKEVKY